ncbi:MAG: hypothetical protein MR727_12275 [Lentisphaeria bacterium]|nr:hypothetical protein [Lentisphaeria bacterium]
MKLNPLFSDGAVFQRDQQIAVWGRRRQAICRCRQNGQGKKRTLGRAGMVRFCCGCLQCRRAVRMNCPCQLPATENGS